MNVLHVMPAYFPAIMWGGPIFSIYGLDRALAEFPEIHIKVLTTDAAGPGISERVNVREKPFAFASRHEVIYARKVAGDSVSAELIRRLPSLVQWADLVHLSFTYSFPTIPTLLACRLVGKPLVWSPHGALQHTRELSDVRRSRLKKAWESLCNVLLVKERCVLHVTSEQEKTASLRSMPRAKAIVVPNGVDIPPSIAPRTRPRQGYLRLMFLGRINPIKGLENLFQALKLLPDRGITLDIYGHGNQSYTQSLKSLVRQLDLDSRVTFRGYVSNEQKTAAFAEADVCIVASHKENFCNVVAESLAHAVPVIVSKGAPWPSIVERGCGLWVDNDPQSLAVAIQQMAAMNLTQMGQRGRTWVTSEFSWKRVSEMMLDLYQTTISKSGSHE